MFDHVTIRASEREASEQFYSTVLRALEVEPTATGGHFVEWDDFSLAAASIEKPFQPAELVAKVKALLPDCEPF